LGADWPWNRRTTHRVTGMFLSTSMRLPQCDRCFIRSCGSTTPMLMLFTAFDMVSLAPAPAAVPCPGSTVCCTGVLGLLSWVVARADWTHSWLPVQCCSAIFVRGELLIITQVASSEKAENSCSPSCARCHGNRCLIDTYRVKHRLQNYPLRSIRYYLNLNVLNVYYSNIFWCSIFLDCFVFVYNTTKVLKWNFL